MEVSLAHGGFRSGLLAFRLSGNPGATRGKSSPPFVHVKKDKVANCELSSGSDGPITADTGSGSLSIRASSSSCC